MKSPRTLVILKNVGLALGLVGVVNLIIFSGAGFSTSGTRGGDLIRPIPGWIVGAVWTALFVGLGIVRGAMEAIGSPAARRARRAALILLAACAAYPFYTVGLHDEIIGLFGNIATICLSLWAAIQMRPVRRLALIAPLAIVAWVGFATLALIDEAHVFGPT